MFGEKFRDRRFETAVGVLYPAQPLGSGTLGEEYQLVNLTSGQFTAPLDVDSFDLTTFFNCGLEDPKLRGCRSRPGIPEFEVETQVRFVAAVAIHGLGIGHAGKWIGQFYTPDLGKQTSGYPFRYPHNVVFRDERHFYIDLGEFRLPIRT